MNDDVIRKVLDLIDAKSDVGDPRSHTWRGKPDTHVFVTANKDGCIRLARSFLLAALAPVYSEPSSRPITIDEPHTQVWRATGDFVIGFIQRAEVIPISNDVIARKAWKQDRLACICCATVAFIIGSLILSGVFFWIAIFTGNPRFMP